MIFKKGDNVKVISGAYAKKTGVISAVILESGRISVDGVNVFKKRMKPKKQGEKGQVISVSRPFQASNAMLICKSCKKAVRVGFRMEGNKKVRYCKKCNAIT